MTHGPRNASRYESLRASRRVLGAMGPLVQLGLLGTGLALFLGQTRALLSDVQFTYGERVVLAVSGLTYLVGFGLVGWVAGRLIRALAESIDVVVDLAESAGRAAELIEWHVVPTLGRAAVALERAAAAPAARAPADGKALALAGARQAIEAGRWGQAERLVQGFARDFPDAPEARALADELAGSRQEAVSDLRARLDAARQANDPNAVIGFRDELTKHLRGDPLRELDRDVIRWLMGLLQRRMRAGSVRPDVAELAARMAESFGDTPEGASLRASLPTLRRSAGLCPRCARPYLGVDDACPECLSPAPRVAPGTSPEVRPPSEDAPS